MSSNIDKIIRTIDFANSDRREDAYESIIIDVLFNYNEALTIEEIFELIVEEYSIKPNKNELVENLEIFVSKGSIILNNNKYSLETEFKFRVQKIFLRNKENKKIRDNNLKEIIIQISDKAPSENDLNLISEAFYNYIYECFLLFGSRAINFFISNTENSIDDKENLITGILKDFKISPHKEIFIKLLKEYPLKLNRADLEYLADLALKAESFFSICLDKETYEEIQKSDILDWTIFVDTNFLYSILNLHNHPENSACNEIVEIAKRDIGIKLKYLPSTLLELKLKKKELEENIPKIQFTKSQIKALINSNQIDEYAKQYYQEKLNDINTPHPSEKVDLAQQILKAKGITIFNQNLRILDDDNLLDIRYKEYVDYINILNDARVSKGLEEKPDRTPEKIDHDIILREVIVYVRGKNDEINNTKYYGITLDKILIKYDRYVCGKYKSDIVNPTFFYPSFILKKFRKLLPLETDNYKRAFIAAISSKTFDTDKPRSKVVQRTVSYFRKLGIDNEQIILEYLNNDYFLKEVEKNEATNTVEVFIESEVSKKLSFLDKKNLEINEELIKRDKQLTLESEEHNLKNDLIKKLKKDKEFLENEISKINSEIQESENLAKSKIETYETEIANLKFGLDLLTEQILRDRAENLFNIEVDNYNKRKKEFITDETPKELKYFRKSRRIVIIYGIILFTLISISSISLILRFISTTPSYLTDNFLILLIIFILFIIISLIDRLFTKFVPNQVFIDGWKFLFSMKAVKVIVYKTLEELFESQNKKPSQDEIFQGLKKQHPTRGVANVG